MPEPESTDPEKEARRNILEAAALGASGRDPERKKRLEHAILTGLHESGDDGFVAFKGALDIYVGLREEHFPAFPEFVYSVKLPWVLSEFTDEEHAAARAQMSEEQRLAMDRYHSLVERVFAQE
jgi:hypothetical protein